jgi:sugar (pentulose or hexulose) kinase
LKPACTLIFDIGKTTKKALVFDESFHVLEEKTSTIPEGSDDEGFPCEDLSNLVSWVNEMVGYFLSRSDYFISHINFSGYGASLVCIDNAGNVVLPFYNYLKAFPSKLEKQFKAAYDADGRLSENTASPWLGMLNSGLQAYWLKHEKPRHFHQTKTLLHFPQYFPFLLTGKKMCDVTSIGCHTMLWDFQRMDYHLWTKSEGVAGLFPPVTSPADSFTLPFQGREITFGSGVHDSSAALMPYLVSMDEPFLLLSTGTWNICFNPFNSEALTSDELQQDCLSYLTYEGKPVKASRIFLGHEHEVQQKALSAFFGVSAETHKEILFDEQIYETLRRENDPQKVFFPMGMKGSGPFIPKQEGHTPYHRFSSYAEAQHELIRSLVRWQMLSIDLVDPRRGIRKIIMVGGFSKSSLFIEILKREMSDRTILLSDHPRASALGAAWLVHKPEKYLPASRLLQVKEA